jgi:O-antigen ligase
MKDRVGLGLGLAVALRLWLDLTWLPVAVAQGITALLGMAFVAVGWRRLAHHPLRAPLVAFGAWTLLGLLRGGDPEALRYGAHLLVPLAWLLASERADPRWPRWLLIAGLVPVAASLVWLGLDQPSQHVLHGVPRLHGAFRNLHGHAVGMALLASVGLWEVTREDGNQPLGVFVAGLAANCLLLAYVRTLWIFVGLVALVLLLLGRRWVVLGVAGSFVLLLVALSTRVQERFADIVAVLTLQAPDDGWAAIGSWRGRIWAESVQAYAEGPWWHWVVGRGLGEHVGLHKHLDPHNEYLSLVFQLGGVGLALWWWLMGAAAWACWKAGERGRLGLALLVAVVATCAVSNEWLTRATMQWVTFGAVGWALREDRAEVA